MAVRGAVTSEHLNFRCRIHNCQIDFKMRFASLGCVESLLDKRGHSLVPLSNPGFVSEIGLESSEHGTLLQK